MTSESSSELIHFNLHLIDVPQRDCVWGTDGENLVSNDQIDDFVKCAYSWVITASDELPPLPMIGC